MARHPKMEKHVISDERSAGYVALGIAISTQQPVALVCTSGTAAINFYPAIAEAFYVQAPLVVFTADRPEEWIDQGNGQSIRQRNLFASHVKKSFHLPVSVDHPDGRWMWDRNIQEALITSKSSPAGPVHVNVPLREPLYEGLDLIDSTTSFKGKKIEWIPSAHTLSDVVWEMIKNHLQHSTNILCVAGFHGKDASLVSNLEAWSTKSQVPVISEITSNTLELTTAIHQADGILAKSSAKDKEALNPDCIISWGTDWLSRHTKSFLRSSKPTVHIHLSESTDIFDPFQTITHQIQIKPSLFFKGLVERSIFTKSSIYYQTWKTADEAIIRRKNLFFEKNTWNEFGVAQKVMANLPQHTVLHVANSMSVRYANFALADSIKNKNITVWSNRGTSGIDGCISTAVGYALTTEDLVVLLIGDMAFQYDINALWNSKWPKNLKIIVLNNNGGVIFRLIEGPKNLPELETYFQTEHEPPNIEELSKAFGKGYAKATSYATLDSILPDWLAIENPLTIIEVSSSARANDEAVALWKEFLIS